MTTIRIYETLPADAVVICAFARDSRFADDVRATCTCGAAICHRPHMIGGTKLCPRCGIGLALAQPQRDFGITKKTAYEVRLYLAAQKGTKQ